MTDARITVFPDRFQHGWNGDPEQLSNLRWGDSLPLVEALERRWETDAHFVQWAVPGDDRSPRLNKPSLGFFQVQAPEQIPELQVIAIDVDFPDHKNNPWTWDQFEDWPPPMRAWYAHVLSVRDTTPELQTAGTYLTRHGMRFIWPLAKMRQVGVPFAESYIEQFLDYIIERGLDLDRLYDWTRVFRLPRVVRDSVPQDLQMSLHSMRELDWEPPRALKESGPRAVGRAARTDMPALEDIDKPKMSEFNRVKSRHYFDDIRHGRPFAPPGKRHEDAKPIIGSLVSCYDTNDPLIPFRLMMASAKAAEWDLGEFWGLCVWVCQVHDGTKRLVSEEKKKIVATTAEQMECEPEQVPSRLIMAMRSGTTYYIWDEKRACWSSSITNAALIHAELAQRCPNLSEDIPAGQSLPLVLRYHSTTINRVILTYVKQRSEYDNKTGVLWEPAAPLDPSLRPAYSLDVDGWLRAFFGDKYAEGVNWLATFLRLDRPTCALYIHGPRSIGKGMFVLGLARLWRTAPVKYEEFMANFQDGLVQCPLVVADEKVPEDPFSENDSSVFRRALGTGLTKISRKYRAPADLEGYPRVVITANNADALRIREAMDSEDVEAIQERVGYIRTDNSALTYLQKLAADKGVPVQEMTEGWVAGAAIARHVMWLNENHEVEFGDRFLVAGWPSALTDDMAIRFGSAPLLGKFIARVIRDKERTPGVLWGDGKVLVNIDKVRDAWQRIMGKSSRVPGDQTLMKALQVLSDGTHERRRPPGDSKGNPRYYWTIPPERVARISEEFYIADAETILKTIKLPGAPTKQPKDADPMKGRTTG